MVIINGIGQPTSKQPPAVSSKFDSLGIYGAKPMEGFNFAAV